MIFSLAGHNKEHFLVEDPLWDEALFENVDAQNIKNILTNHKDMECKMSAEYILQNFILKRGKRKTITYAACLHLYVPFVPRTVEERFPHLIPS